ncbi:MAG: Spx/MgsR family RNA polymerase-binding regulatory protein [Bacteriovoracaceae bacterium]|nr:Spx/MgsR family RNA polymerase-binding regulatory protein [Bacteriovoracaceae bacterium]
MYQIYGISNCDTVKKARKHLEALEVEFEFHDFKKVPPTKALISRWTEKLGELPVNKRGRTYREVKEDFESLSASKKIEMIIEKSSLIKRPLLEKNNKPVSMGYSKDEYEQLT